MSNAKPTFQELQDGCRGLAAIRLKLHLQQVAGAGAKVFPSTHLKGEYAKEVRTIPNGAGVFEKSNAVLIDSVQSQANRLETTATRMW